MKRQFRLFEVMILLGYALTLFIGLPATRISAAGEIIINQDGNVVGTASIERSGSLYVLKANIHDPVRVLKSDIVIDGAGYVLEGGGSENGVTLSAVHNVTVKNLVIKTFTNGIIIEGSSKCKIDGVNSTLNFQKGIVLIDSLDNSISQSNFLANNQNGVLLQDSSGNTIINNTMKENKFESIMLNNSQSNTVSDNTIADNIWSGIYLEYCTGNVVTDNVITDNDYYAIALVSSSRNNVVSDNTVRNNAYGIGFFGNSGGNTVSANTVTNSSGHGILFYYSSSNTVSGNTVTNSKYDGISLWNFSSSNRVSENTIKTNTGCGIAVVGFSSSNTVSENMVTSNADVGIYLFNSSSSNTISGNTIEENNDNGVWLEDTSGNTIINNMMKENFDGIMLANSSSNAISGNTIANNTHGIHFFNYSSTNTVSSNILTDNDVGIYLEKEVHGNSVYNNNFLNNGVQVTGSPSGNTWGSPSGGNYWSDYEGIDQNGDGIGETLTPHYEDRFPLIVPSKPIPVFWKDTRYDCTIVGNVTVSKFLVGYHKATNFNFTGQGYVNVTFPKEMLDGSFKVYVNNIQVPCLSSWTENQISILIECTSPVTANVKIEAEIKLFGDLNGDGRINIIDISLVATKFGKQLD